MMGRSPLDLYWGIIILMLFFPILVPFGFLLIVMYFYETESIEKDRLTGLLSCFRSRFIAYSLAFVFSPVFEVIALVVAYFAISYAIGMKSYYNTTKTETIFRLIIGNMLCNIISVVFFAGLAVLIAVLPVLGSFFMVTKFYYIFTRCFKPKAGFEYPRLFG